MMFNIGSSTKQGVLGPMAHQKRPNTPRQAQCLSGGATGRAEGSSLALGAHLAVCNLSGRQRALEWLQGDDGAPAWGYQLPNKIKALTRLVIRTYRRAVQSLLIFEHVRWLDALSFETSQKELSNV